MEFYREEEELDMPRKDVNECDICFYIYNDADDTYYCTVCDTTKSSDEVEGGL